MRGIWEDLLTVCVGISEKLFVVGLEKGCVMESYQAFRSSRCVDVASIIGLVGMNKRLFI